MSSLVAILNGHDREISVTSVKGMLAEMVERLGQDKYLKIPGWPPLSHSQKELEAESLSYILYTRNGVASESEKYLASYGQRRPAVKETLNIYPILKAAG